jgi:hypothetical protein
MSDQFSPRLATGWPGVSPDLSGSWTEGLLPPVIARQFDEVTCPTRRQRCPSAANSRWQGPFL